MLRRRSNPDTFRAIDTAKIQCCQPDTASRTLNHHAIPLVERAHHNKQLISRNIVDEHASPHLRTHLWGTREDSNSGHTNHISIPSEVCEGQNRLVYLELGNPF